MIDSGACFDFDGVLLDSAASIVGSLQTAMFSTFAIDVETDVLRRRVGETLPDIFKSIRPDLGEADLAAAIDAFRRDFGRRMWTAELYAGAVEMLDAAKASGAAVLIVSTKPQPFLDILVDRYGLRPHIDGAFGGSLEEAHTDKTPILGQALAAHGLQPQRSCLVGDRKFDVVAALALGVEPLGAAWGYGGRDELAEAGCARIFDHPSELAGALNAQDHPTARVFAGG